MELSQSAVVVSLRARKTALWLAACALGLVAVSSAFAVLKVLAPGAVPVWLVDMFRLNQEGNIPAFFSGALLLASAGLFAVVSWGERRTGHPRHRIWMVLALMFVFLAYDELFAVHERLIEPMRERFDLPGFLYFAWVPVYAGIVVVVALGFWRLWRDLPKPIAFGFAAAAVIYVTGAVGFEMLGAALYTGVEGDIVYGAMYTIEETLEMAGLITLIYSLIRLLGTYPVAMVVGHRPEHPPASRPADLQVDAAALRG